MQNAVLQHLKQHKNALNKSMIFAERYQKWKKKETPEFCTYSDDQFEKLRKVWVDDKDGKVRMN